MRARTMRVPATTLAGRREVIATLAAFAAAGLASRTSIAAAQAIDEVSHMTEAIHQERHFKASRQQVYDALTVSAQFDKLTQLSGVMQSPYMAKMQKPTQIGKDCKFSPRCYTEHRAS